MSARLGAIKARATLSAMHRRSRDAALDYAREGRREDRLEWVAVARVYQRALLKAKRKERAQADELRIAQEQRA